MSGSYRICKPAGEISVGLFKIFAAVVGNHYAVIICADKNSVRIIRVNGDRIDLQFSLRRHRPRFSAVGRHPKTFGRRGINSSRSGRMLENIARSARLATEFPEFSSIFLRRYMIRKFRCKPKQQRDRDFLN